MTEDQFAAYRTAKSTRPAWANALIVAGVIFLAGVAVAAMSGLAAASWFLIAAAVTALIAGILALAGISRRVP